MNLIKTNGYINSVKIMYLILKHITKCLKRYFITDGLKPTSYTRTSIEFSHKIRSLYI